MNIHRGAHRLGVVAGFAVAAAAVAQSPAAQKADLSLTDRFWLIVVLLLSWWCFYAATRTVGWVIAGFSGRDQD